MEGQHLTFFLIQLILLAEHGLSFILTEETEQVQQHHRQRRNIVQMCDLIHFHTGRGCLEFNDYGCYCGLGNANSQPLDEVDSCCQVHDHCYGAVTCLWLYPQVVGYTTNCTTRPCTCTDSPLLNACAYTTCRCDLQFAECLANAEYNAEYKDYDHDLCNRRRRRRHRRRRGRHSRRQRDITSLRRLLLRKNDSDQH